MWTRPNTLSVRFKVDFCCGGCDPAFGFCRRHLRQEKPSPWITCRKTPGAFGRLSDRVHVTARRTEQTRPVQKARMPCSGHAGRPSLEAAAFATSQGTVRVDLRTGVTVWPVQAGTQKEGQLGERQTLTPVRSPFVFPGFWPIRHGFFWTRSGPSAKSSQVPARPLLSTYFRQGSCQQLGFRKRVESFPPQGASPGWGPFLCPPWSCSWEA